MIESLTASMNKRFNKTTTSMNEMFHKSQASTDTTLERVQCGIVAMADQVQALETQLPIAQLTQMWWLTQILQQLTHMLTMIHSIKIQGLTMMSTPIFMILLHTHVGPSTDKVLEVIQITTTNTMFTTKILLLKLNFLSLLLMASMMLRLI
jgi:hypothetical protein